MIIRRKSYLSQVIKLSVILFYFLSSYFALGGFLYWLPILLVIISLLVHISPEFKFQKSLYFKWIFSFVSISILSLLWSENIVIGFSILKYLIPVFIFTFYIYLYTSSQNDLNNVLIMYYLSQVITLIYIIFSVDIWSLSNERLGGEHLGSNFNSNSIAYNLCFAVYTGIFLIKRFSSKLLKITVIIVTILMIIVIILTGSRGGYLLLSFPFLLYTIFYLPKKWIASIIILLSALFLINTDLSRSVTHSLPAQRVSSIFLILQNKQEDARSELINLGIEWFQTKPFLGHGINNFRALSNESESFRGDNFYAHNNYIEILVDLGIIGLILYYYIYYVILKRCMRTKKNYYLIPLLVSIIIYEFVEVTYYSVTFQFFISIFFVLTQKNQKISSETYYVDKNQ